MATFSKPTNNTGKGVYQLKEDFYADYDVFFYHYTREDQSKSEEVQRARLKAADRPQVSQGGGGIDIKGCVKGIQYFWVMQHSGFLIFSLLIFIFIYDNFYFHLWKLKGVGGNLP